MEMRMTFVWARSSESLEMYVFNLVSVFVLSLLVECLSHTRFVSSETDNVVAGLVQTGLYGARITMAYLVMLAVMSFNVGVLLVAVGGYTLGFLVFGSRVFDRSEYQKAFDLPPLTC
nr:copper transporter 1-like [Ipomoea batatas]